MKPRKDGPRARGRPPKAGARALARALAAGALDRRTWVARALEEIVDGLASDRGGLEHCSAAERILIERAASETLFLRLIEAWALNYVLAKGSIVAETMEGSRLIGPLGKGYTSHLGALTRALTALGIRPDKVDRLPDLGDYLKERDRKAPARAPASGKGDGADDQGTSPRPTTDQPCAEPDDQQRRTT